jgi:HEAT repeat protein
MALLSRNAHADLDRRRWQVQQQATLALSRIYAQPQICGRIYCDGDPPARIARVREAWLRVMASDRAMRSLPVRELIDRFRHEPVFWRQLEIGRALAAAGDRAAIAALEAWLTHDDRHQRGNAALVLGRLGDPRGFDTLAAILADHSPRPEPEGGDVMGRWSLERQVRSDRFYAAHLLGELKDPRGVDLLVPLLDDEDVGYKVPWSLAEIGDRRAIPPLIAHLDRDDPSVRVYTISALEQLTAHEALPKLRELLGDARTSRLGRPISVADAARHAMAGLAR